MQRPIYLIVVGVLSLFILIPGANSGNLSTNYDFMVINVDPGYRLVAMNDKGVVLLDKGIGEFKRDSSNIMLWQNGDAIGTAYELDWAYDINNNGVVAGYCDDARHREACIGKNEETISGISGMYVIKINDRDQVLTYSYLADCLSGEKQYYAINLGNENKTQHIYWRWYPCAGVPGHASEPEARDVNNLGEVVGRYDPGYNENYSAFLWKKGEMADLNDLLADDLDYRLTSAHAINDKGQIIGETSTGHSFLFENGSITEFENLHLGTINDQGHMSCSMGGQAGIVKDGTCIPINKMIDPSSGWKINSVVDINEDFQMIGYGEFDGKQYPVILNPLPEALFTADQHEGTAPFTVAFTDASSGIIHTWEWYFGDGGTSDAQHPRHTYTTPGLYTVTLNISGPHGSDRRVKTDDIIVGCESRLYFEDTDGDGFGNPWASVYACSQPQGYIAPAGVSELITNGTMEKDAGWHAWDTPTANERSSETSFTGNFSRKFTADSVYEGITSKGFTLTAGKSYRISFQAYGEGTAPLRSGVAMNRANNSQYYPDKKWPIPPASWTEYSWSYTPGTTGQYIFYAQLAPGGIAGTFYIDDVSVVEVSNIAFDCDDDSMLSNPGVEEKCNGIDDNCNGKVDEGVQSTFYRDRDKDGYGTPDDAVKACSPPSGYVKNSSDLCDHDPQKTKRGACGCNVPDTDVDEDGVPDCSDACPGDPEKTEPGACGCGAADVDSDQDGVPDCSDKCPSDPNKSTPGICGCGRPDADADADGALDCKDGCPSDPGKTAPGDCGCGQSDMDSDKDGTPDCRDGCPHDAENVVPGKDGCKKPEDRESSGGNAEGAGSNSEKSCFIGAANPWP